MPFFCSIRKLLLICQTQVSQEQQVLSGTVIPTLPLQVLNHQASAESGFLQDGQGEGRNIRFNQRYFPVLTNLMALVKVLNVSQFQLHHL